MIAFTLPALDEAEARLDAMMLEAFAGQLDHPVLQDWVAIKIALKESRVPRGTFTEALVRRAIEAATQATSDPGAFTPRGDDYTEAMGSWQRRAFEMALQQVLYPGGKPEMDPAETAIATVEAMCRAAAAGSGFALSASQLQAVTPYLHPRQPI